MKLFRTFCVIVFTLLTFFIIKEAASKEAKDTKLLEMEKCRYHLSNINEYIRNSPLPGLLFLTNGTFPWEICSDETVRHQVNIINQHFIQERIKSMDIFFKEITKDSKEN